MGARLYFGGGGGSSSSSNTTNNADKRISAGAGGVGVSGDQSNVTITDSGIVTRALNSVDISNVLASDNFGKLMDSATKMFNTSEGLIGQTQKSVADAYSAASTDKAGAIDQKTMIVLGVAAAAVVIAVNNKK